MVYSNIPGIEFPISNIIFGCCNPILINDEAGAEELLEVAFNNGFNIFDTAKVYGKSEEVLGRWMKTSGVRDKVAVVTKGCHPDITSRLNVECLMEDVESSLERLRTDYIDVYMLHRDDPNADILLLLGKLNEYVNKGIIRKIGVSNWTHKRIDEINKIARDNNLTGVSVSSPQMSPARQIRDPWGGGCVSISWDDEAKRWYANHPEVVVFAYSCLGRGMFSGKADTKHLLKLWRSLDGAGRKGYWSIENIRRLREAERIAQENGKSVAQIAIAWCMSRGFKVFPICTMSSEERMLENIEAINIVMEWQREDIHRIQKGQRTL